MEQLRAAVQELNPSLSAAAIEEAITKIRTYEGGSLVQKNEQFTDYLQNGVAVNYFDGREQRSELVRLVAQAHDLLRERLAAFAAEKIIVLKDGKICESGPSREIMQTPRHPYTKALIDALPRLPEAYSRLTL